jgi:hypothetical protein
MDKILFIFQNLEEKLQKNKIKFIKFDIINTSNNTMTNSMINLYMKSKTV